MYYILRTALIHYISDQWTNPSVDRSSQSSVPDPPERTLEKQTVFSLNGGAWRTDPPRLSGSKDLFD